MYSRMLKHFLSFHLVSFIICCPLLYEGLYKQSYMLIIQVINVLFLFILARQKGIYKFIFNFRIYWVQLAYYQ